MRSARNIALYVLLYYNKRNCGISNQTLQCILYFLQAQFLVNTGKPCFREPIFARSSGPVIKEVNSLYSKYGTSRIPVPTEMPDLKSLSSSDKALIDPVLDEVHPLSPARLLRAAQGQEAWKKASRSLNKKINNDDIYHQYVR